MEPAEPSYAPARPRFVTAAGGMLLVKGALHISEGFLLRDGIASLVAGLVVGGAAIWAGKLVLQRRRRGALIGIVLAGLGVAGALIFDPAILILPSIALNGFILWALASNDSFFRASISARG